jgi:hypothetical protein
VVPMLGEVPLDSVIRPPAVTVTELEEHYTRALLRAFSDILAWTDVLGDAQTDRSRVTPRDPVDVLHEAGWIAAVIDPTRLCVSVTFLVSAPRASEDRRPARIDSRREDESSETDGNRERNEKS